MKKFTVLVALALLAVTGTSYAVTCSQDNVPAATLLVPYFKVSRNGATTGPIGDGGVNTIVAMTNVSQWGVIAHVTVWNKQSAPVVDFNVPLTGYDVAFFSMKTILNGDLNVNPKWQKLDSGNVDPCKNVNRIGTAQDDFMRFRHPYWGVIPSDWNDAIAFYDTPAFSGAFRNRIWDSLDESADYVSLIARPSNDADNPACSGRASDVVFSGDFTGYLTINVVNYCTNFFPSQENYYEWDAIATLGWERNGVGPNVLMGDVFFVDPAAATGNISGEAAVAIEFDERLEAPANDWDSSPYKTFYARYSIDQLGGGLIDDPLPVVLPASATYQVPAAYQFTGDGREPLGTAYGFRFLNDTGMQTWMTVWRGDYWDSNDDTTIAPGADADLCTVADNGRFISVRTWNNDEDEYTVAPPGGGPSGEEPEEIASANVWWEANRVLINSNSGIMDDKFKGGWTKMTFNPNNSTRYHQAWVGVQHTAPGAFVSVGHSATLLDNQFTCPGDINFGFVGNSF
jgi:hypothetical protein